LVSETKFITSDRAADIQYPDWAIESRWVGERRQNFGESGVDFLSG